MKKRKDMKTKILTTKKNDIETAARIIRRGGLVAFPTETVYDLVPSFWMKML